MGSVQHEEARFNGQGNSVSKVGADLFGIYEESEVKSPEKSPMEKSVKEVPTSTRLVRTASMISPDEVP